ncbi:hypothetical protein HPB50_024774 [Hyalomma asiaticum]|uniref:Uncharacterized protein n=1 Tax=Hyalomma asiaticum TaxID=266040 RepID=A0ACB7TBA3_HYAAI|nr:hypothetical protein HPB50_024774 [Hyalomma asiaticum]
MGSSKKSRSTRSTSSRRKRRERRFEEAAAGPEEDPKAVLQSERRALLWATLAAMLGFFLWIICIGTEQWVTVAAPESGPVYVNRTKSFFFYANMGLFRMCRTTAPAMPNGTPGAEESSCSFFSVFPSEEAIRHDMEIDRTILEYTRSEVAFCTLSLVMLLMGIGFSVYTFKEHRYMFKRLAGGVHFISAGVMMVVMEVENNSASYEERYLNSRLPKGCRWNFGFSYYFAWVTFSTYVIIGLTFMVCSRKRKGLTGVNDEPQIIGR